MDPIPSTTLDALDRWHGDTFSQTQITTSVCLRVSVVSIYRKYHSLTSMIIHRWPRSGWQRVWRMTWNGSLGCTTAIEDITSPFFFPCKAASITFKAPAGSHWIYLYLPPSRRQKDSCVIMNASWCSVKLKWNLLKGGPTSFKKFSCDYQHLPAFYALLLNPSVPQRSLATGRTLLARLVEIFWNVPDAIVLLYISARLA